jgi:hypothetical protein
MEAFQDLKGWEWVAARDTPSGAGRAGPGKPADRRRLRRRVPDTNAAGFFRACCRDAGVKVRPGRGKAIPGSFAATSIRARGGTW